MRVISVVFACVLAVCVAGDSPTFASRVRGAYLGAQVADALCLGTHYEYDAVKIKAHYGNQLGERYFAPGEATGGQTHGVGWGSRNYHNGNGNGPAKRAGEGTDYGDYSRLVLEHLAATSSSPHAVDLRELVPRWQQSLASWRSWMCTQTRQTLQQVQHGTPFDRLGGNSNAMAVRFAAALGYFSSEDELVQAAKTVMFTHRERSAHEGVEFVARVAFRVVHLGLAPRDAIEAVASESTSAFIRQKVRQAIDKVDEATNPDRPLSKQEFVDDLAVTSMARLWDVGKTEPIKVGKASPTEGTLPSALYFILKYAGDFKAAAAANCMVGGDNASRAMVVGMIMGGHLGEGAIPPALLQALEEKDSAMDLLRQLPLLRTGDDGAEL